PDEERDDEERGAQESTEARARLGTVDELLRDGGSLGDRTDSFVGRGLYGGRNLRGGLGRELRRNGRTDGRVLRHGRRERQCERHHRFPLLLGIARGNYNL